MRHVIEFPCAGETLVGTLDEAAGTIGLLIVSGGNEIRMGAHRGMALLARKLAATGIPVLRYDRRGIGDSSGVNAGFRVDRRRHHRRGRRVSCSRSHPHRRGSAIATRPALSRCSTCRPESTRWCCPIRGSAAARTTCRNPPRFERAYVERLRDPREWLRLFRGGVDLRKLTCGLLKIARSQSEDDELVDRMAVALKESGVATTILLAERDDTAIAFRDAWRKCAEATDASIRPLDSASHSYAGEADKKWLFDRLLDATR